MIIICKIFLFSNFKNTTICKEVSTMEQNNLVTQKLISFLFLDPNDM